MPRHNNRTKLSDKDFLLQFRNQTDREITDELQDTIDNVLVNSENEDDMKRQIIRFSKTIKEIPNVGTSDYVRACFYVSLYATGHTQEQAYRKVFPERVAKKREGVSTISNSANAYHHSMTVQSIWKQVGVEDSVHFLDKRWKAYAVLEEIMDDKHSTNKEKIEAASKLANLLKAPKDTMVRVDVGFENKEMKALEAKLAEVASAQINLLQSGQISNKEIVEAELLNDNKDKDNG